jgi:hypothetical protein
MNDGIRTALLLAVAAACVVGLDSSYSQAVRATAHRGAPGVTAPNEPGTDAAATAPKLAPATDAEPKSHVDSVRSIADELARFRVGLTPVTDLHGGARSRGTLIKQFLAALAAHDTVTLQRLHLTRAEYAYLYYPYTVHTHPPYEQPAGLAWMLTTQSSQKGLKRLLARLAGTRPPLAGYTCASTEPQDLNILHRECVLKLQGNSAPQQLFGTIIERNGRFKFVSYSNGL